MSATQLLHAALPCDTKEHAIQFYQQILNLQLQKEFSISEELSQQIFGIPTAVTIMVFSNEQYQIEVFLTKEKTVPTFHHLCISIPNTHTFMNKCTAYGLVPYEVKKGEKTLVFMRDFVGNLFEIKELK